jgi:hypothetical protein
MIKPWARVSVSIVNVLMKGVSSFNKSVKNDKVRENERGMYALNKSV